MSRNDLSQRAKSALIGGVGGGLVTSLMTSTRRKVIEGQAIEAEYLAGHVPAIYVLWHGRLLSCAYQFRKYGLATLISQNRDGDYISRMIEGWGYRVIRGSSSRGGTAALRAIVRHLREGGSVAVTPDGPRGPRQKMKPGPLLAARLSGVPLITVAASAVHSRFFGRWDRFQVPLPFTRVPVALGGPITIDPAADEAEIKRASLDLECQLDALTRLVDEAAGVDPQLVGRMGR